MGACGLWLACPIWTTREGKWPWDWQWPRSFHNGRKSANRGRHEHCESYEVPELCVLSLRQVSHIKSGASQPHLRTKQAPIFPKNMEKIFQATGNIVSCFKLVIKKPCFSIAPWSVNWKAIYFSELKQEYPKESWQAWTGCLVVWFPILNSFSGSFIHQFIDTLIFLLSTHLPIHHSPISPPIPPSPGYPSTYPASLHQPPILPSIDPFLNITSA